MTTGHKSEFDLCEQHGRDISLYCDEINCDKAICQLCMLKNHSGHRVVDIVDNQKQLISSHLRFLSQQLQSYRNYMIATKSEIGNASICLRKRVSTKEDELKEGLDETIAKIDQHTATIDELKWINEADVTYKNLTERIKTIEDMKSKITEDLHEPVHTFFELTDVEMPVTGFQVVQNGNT